MFKNKKRIDELERKVAIQWEAIQLMNKQILENGRQIQKLLEEKVIREAVKG